MKTSIIIGLIALVLGVAVFLSLQRQEPQVASNHDPEFLAKCKTSDKVLDCYWDKLLAFADKNGVAKTLEIVRMAEKDFPELYQNCNHPLGTGLGEKAYQAEKNVSVALALGLDCRGGFARGVMNEFYKENSSLLFVEAKEKVCTTEEKHKAGCYFRMGFLAVQKATSVSEAFDSCKEIARGTGFLTGCIGGATTEILYQLATIPQHKVNYGTKSFGINEEIALCNNVIQVYKEGCFSGIPRKYLFISPQERQEFLLNGPTSICRDFPIDRRTICYSSVGITLDTLFFANVGKTIDLCLEKSNTTESAGCLKGALDRYEFSGAFTPEKKKEICYRIPTSYREDIFYKKHCAP